MILFRCLCFVLFFACLSQGCGKRHIQITRDMRRTIDTLSAREIHVLRPVTDSVCASKSDSLVSVMTDSILIIRQGEIRKLLGQ